MHHRRGKKRQAIPALVRAYKAQLDLTVKRRESCWLKHNLFSGLMRKFGRQGRLELSDLCLVATSDELRVTHDAVQRTVTIEIEKPPAR
jgi:hypothetical protein